MKKRLEKIILVITLVFVIGIKGVNALSVNSTTTVKDTGSPTADTNLKYGDSNNSYYVTNYRQYTISSGESAYCLDPASNIKNGNTYTVTASSTQALADGNDTQAAYLIGMAAILAEGESNGYDYIDISFAIRTFSVGTFGQTRTCYYSAHSKYLQSAYINLAQEWNSQLSTGNSSIANLLNVLSTDSVYKPAYLNTPSTGYYSGSVFTATGQTTTLSDALALYTIGLQAAADVLNGTTTSTGTAAISGSILSTDSTNGEIYMKITAKDFTDGFVTNISVSGVTVTQLYVRSNGSYVAVSSGANFLDYANSDGEIYIKAAYSTASCNSSKLTVTYNYYTSNMAEYTAYLLIPSGSNGSCSWQNFVSYAVTGSSDSCDISNAASCGYTDSFTGTISCSTGSACPTSLTSPICSDNESESTATIEGPDDIKTCVLKVENGTVKGGTDEALNEYQLGTGNGGLTNSYCSIYCKEDYSEIKFNEIVENVVCGGYFQLTASITGTKTCYTGGNGTTNGDGSIDFDKYKDDVKKVQEEILAAYTQYKMAEQALTLINAGQIDTHTNDRCTSDTTIGSGGNVGYTISFNYTVYNAYFNADGSINTSRGSNGIYTTSATESYGNAGSSDSYTAAHGYCTDWTSYNKEVCETEYRNGVATDTGYDWVDVPASCTSDGVDGTTIDDLRTYYENLKSSAESTMNSKISKLNSIINEYNQCTTWSNMSYAFKQNVKFYYDELQSDGTYSPYYDLLVSSKEYYLEEDGTGTTSSEIVVCKGTTDTYYVCETGKSVTLSGTTIADGTSSIFKTENFITATTNSLNTYTDDVSQATFISWSITKSQDYISPSVFCQVEATGEVVLCNSGYTGTEVRLETLTNSLPVSTASTGGVFKLILEDFGEFFETGKYGRIFGSSTNSLSVYLNYSSDSALSDDGSYTCYYESPCTPTPGPDCPNCDIVCVGDSCSWEDSSCPDCIVTCVNCLYEEGEFTVSMKTISTTNFTSVNRAFGYNWVTTSTLSTMNLTNTNLTTADLELIGDKAEETISEIESDNETIYDSSTSTSYSKTSGDSSSLGFSIKLTPEVIQTIQDYNEQHESVGGYANDSLTCYDAVIDGVTFTNLFCYSELIDTLVDNYGSQVTVSSNRISSSGNRENSQSSGYWTLWSSYTGDYYTTYVLNGSAIGGPSWK